MEGARDGKGVVIKKKREVRWVWVDLVLLADERPVCMCSCVCEGDSGGRGGGVLLWLSISLDQLMATDEGAEKGQGSKPCIVSLAPLSRGVPSLSLPPSAIRSPEPPAHLHTFINTVCCPVLSGKRLRCTAYSLRYPCSYCSSCIPSNHICKLFMLCPGTGACRGCASA